MSERDVFLKFLAENPDDATTRLVFADWLDEHGEHEEADLQRQWLKARDWLMHLCEANNPPANKPDLYGERISVETLLALAREAIESGIHDGLWFTCRNNTGLRSAILKNESEFWRHATLVTGAARRPPPEEERIYRPCSECW